MEYGLGEIADGIAGLRSDFNWAMSGLLHKLDIQNLLLKDIYIELRIPDFQKERRYYVEQGCKHYTNGLYQESLENFLKAETLEKTGPFVLYSIGQIYLYQPDMIDLDKAQDYFTRAGKYYVAEKKNKQAGESYFHAGIAAYLRRNDVNAPQFAKKASELYPELIETFYNHAKFLAIQGNDSGLTSLEFAIRKDKNYARKVIADKDFSRTFVQVKVLLERLKKEARINAEDSIAYMEKVLDEYVIFNEALKNEIKKEINDLVYYVKTLLVKDCYFDYLECINELRKIHDKLEETTTNITIKEIKNLTGHFDYRVLDIAFSRDGLTLAIMLEYEIKLWQVHTGREIKNLKYGYGNFCSMSHF